jgi:iron complex transport system permease protein
MGGLWSTTWGPLALLAPLTVVAVVGCWFLARPLDLMALGEAHAHRLGVRTREFGSLVLLLACLLAALAVCTAGVLAFVGLIVPHAARRLVGPAHGVLLPASAFLGALLVLATDTVARTAVPPQELPLAVVTSIVGVPCFLIIMRSLTVRRSGL